MQIYLVRPAGQDMLSAWCTNFTDAVALARTTPMHRRPEVRIELLNVATDKETLLVALNALTNCAGDVSTDGWATIIKTWRLKATGGTLECPNGE